MIQYFFLAFPLSILLCWLLAAQLKRRGRRLPVIFYGGLIYVLIALPLLVSWYLYVALGSITLGAALMALRHQNFSPKLQLVISLLPAATFSAFVWYSESSYNIFLIPEGYRGRVVVVHGCRDGAEREFEGLYRVYRIGANGLLKSRFSFAGSAFDHLHSKYYYVDQAGNRKAITELPDGSSADTIGVQGLWTLDADRKGDTFIDFIVDAPVADQQQYRQNELQAWQREIDSCVR